ncbi:MAG TPA: phosphopantetheine-binding protein [Tepidisphaeraceae bacterium]|jgi:3-hydroxyacyl-[acyl-carrier-protein] dehydratase
MGEASPEIIERLRTIVRRDLKLGPNTPIPDDMPFFNSDLDIDSLDILLLVTSIEKEFGIKIPSHAVGKEVFTSMTTLADYIQSNLSGKQAHADNNYLDRLPHGLQFRFISKVTEVSEGQSARGIWTVRGDEDFFAGHFPGRPIVPGVLLTEALAQLSGLAGPPSQNQNGKLVHTDMRFDQSAAPPADILLESRVNRVMGDLQQFDVRASIGTTVLAQGSLTLHRGS